MQSLKQSIGKYDVHVDNQEQSRLVVESLWKSKVGE
jgi:hypothetical protein